MNRQSDYSANDFLMSYLAVRKFRVTCVTSAVNHSITIKWLSVMLLALKKEFSDHKKAPQPQKQPKLAKKCSNFPKNVIFCSVRGLDICYIGIKAQKGVPRLQSGSLITIAAWTGGKVPISSPKLFAPLWQGTRQLLQWQQRTQYSLNDLK